jgi:hypothetical protein
MKQGRDLNVPQLYGVTGFLGQGEVGDTKGCILGLYRAITLVSVKWEPESGTSGSLLQS